MADQLKQQLQSAEEKKMNAPVPETNAIDLKIAEELKKMKIEDADEFEDEIGVEDAAVDNNDSTPLARIFNGDTAVRVKLQAKLLVNISAEPVTLPDVVRSGNGFYSTRSPLRKSKDGPLGSAREPNGIVRDSITSVIEYLATANTEKVVFFGSVGDLQSNIAQMVSYYQESINEIMYRPFGGLTTVKIESTEDEDTVLEDATLNASFFTDNWVTHKQDSRDLLVSPVFAVNLRVPLLVNADNQYKAVVNMSRALHNIGEKFGLLDNLIFAYSVDSESLATPQALGLLNGFHEAQQPVTLVSVGSVARMSEGGDDIIGIYPSAFRFDEACYRLFPFAKFPFGKDMLLIV
jgi:hypothetical protein